MGRVMRRKTPNGIPSAHGIEVYRCNNPDCDAVHIMLRHDDGKQFAMAALSPDQVELIAKVGGYMLFPLQSGDQSHGHS
jgi:hypothetical protein